MIIRIKLTIGHSTTRRQTLASLKETGMDVGTALWLHAQPKPMHRRPIAWIGAFLVTGAVLVALVADGGAVVAWRWGSAFGATLGLVCILKADALALGER